MNPTLAIDKSFTTEYTNVLKTKEDPRQPKKKKKKKKKETNTAIIGIKTVDGESIFPILPSLTAKIERRYK